jgi:hypothetical protein
MSNSAHPPRLLRTCRLSTAYSICLEHRMIIIGSLLTQIRASQLHPVVSPGPDTPQSTLIPTSTTTQSPAPSVPTKLLPVSSPPSKHPFQTLTATNSPPSSRTPTTPLPTARNSSPGPPTAPSTPSGSAPTTSATTPF